MKNSRVMARRIVEQERIKAFGVNGGIKCRCVKCGGIGYAMDESCLDKNGFLIGMMCVCGGKIRRIAK